MSPHELAVRLAGATGSLADTLAAEADALLDQALAHSPQADDAAVWEFVTVAYSATLEPPARRTLLPVALGALASIVRAADKAPLGAGLKSPRGDFVLAVYNTELSKGEPAFSVPNASVASPFHEPNRVALPAQVTSAAVKQLASTHTINPLTAGFSSVGVLNASSIPIVMQLLIRLALPAVACRTTSLHRTLCREYAYLAGSSRRWPSGTLLTMTLLAQLRRAPTSPLSDEALELLRNVERNARVQGDMAVVAVAQELLNDIHVRAAPYLRPYTISAAVEATHTTGVLPIAVTPAADGIPTDESGWGTAAWDSGAGTPARRGSGPPTLVRIDSVDDTGVAAPSAATPSIKLPAVDEEPASPVTSRQTSQTSMPAPATSIAGSVPLRVLDLAPASAPDTAAAAPPSASAPAAEGVAPLPATVVSPGKQEQRSSIIDVQESVV